MDNILVISRAVPDGAKPPKVPSIVQDEITWPKKLIDKNASTDYII